MSGIITQDRRLFDATESGTIGLNVLPEPAATQGQSWWDDVTWPTMPVRIGAMVWLTTTLSLSGGGFPLLGN